MAGESRKGNHWYRRCHNCHSLAMSWPKSPWGLATTRATGLLWAPVTAHGALHFIKSKSRNRLPNPHLSDALRLFFSNTFDILTFPYAEALQAWKEAVDRGRYNKTFTQLGRQERET
ncbi:hypothetical protein FOA52_000352 [Chlamydomonas sp. UWO 241]|nr:hypothetical protein FOA52_000352 [Chlamydomonas sp. UWO 241]